MQRLDVTFEIHWDSPWHVGSGFSSAQVDHLVRRRGGRDGPAFVPGAQIKGVLRYQAERIASLLSCRVVDPHGIDEAGQQALVEHFGPLSHSRLIVDRLFGSRYQGECLFVDDALPVAGRRLRSRDHRVVTRTAIDRATGTVRERHLFSSEIAAGSGLVLESRIRALHPEGVLMAMDDYVPLEYTLLILALLGIEALGGQKAVGQGRCRVSISGQTVAINGQPQPITALLATITKNEWDALRELCEEGRFPS